MNEPFIFAQTYNFLTNSVLLKKQSLGISAQLCPFCFDIRKTEIIQVSSQPFLSFIPVGKANNTFQEITCLHCNSTYISATDDFNTVPKHISITIDNLIEKTNPSIHTTFKERLEAESEISRNRPITESMREALLNEPFAILANNLQQISNHASFFETFSFYSFLICIAVPLSLLGCIALFVSIHPVFYATYETLLTNLFLPLMAAVLITGLVVHLPFRLTAERRIIKRHLLSNLRTMLARLRPSTGEIENILRYYSANGFPQFRLITGNEITGVIQKQK